MSRCFPFPPPGYEKKPQTDHVDLLIKKHKEKKHKKEKRDKEKREDEERKDRDKNKDRSKDKHREKKGKKEKHRDKEKKKDKDRNEDEKKILYEKKNGHTEGHNGRKSGEDSHQVEDPKSAKFMEELGRRIRDEERQAGDQMGADDTGKVQRKLHGVGIATEKERSTGNEVLHSITISEQKRMGIACAMEENGAATETDQNSTGTEQRRFDGMCKPMDKYANKKIERKKDKGHKVDGRKGYKHKDKDREKKHKGKDKARNKEKEKEEKIRRKGEQRHKELDKLRDSLKMEQVASENVNPLFPSNDNAKSAGAGGCPKRKEANGFLHENEVRPSKLLRPSCSFQSQLSLEENGNKSDQSHTGGFCTSVKDVALNLVKVEKTLDNKSHKINGAIDIHSPLNMRRPPLVADAAENGETSKQSPHPDEKHLSQILHLPKMEEWVEFDDQEWLLSRDNLWREPETKLEADETPKVWAEAMRIELGDVVALPFVVPF